MSNTKIQFSKQKGISLLFVVLIMSVILAISLGISGVLVKQTKMIGEIGYSVVSFYAADSGIEVQLFDLYKTPPGEMHHSGNVGDASYEVNAKCGAEVLPEDCPTGFEIDPGCDAPNYCIKSIGTYKQNKRAIEIKY